MSIIYNEVQNNINQRIDPRTKESLNKIRANTYSVALSTYNDLKDALYGLDNDLILECLLNPEKPQCDEKQTAQQTKRNVQPGFLIAVLNYLSLRSASMISDTDLIAIIDQIAPKPDPALAATLAYIEKIESAERQANDALNAMGNALGSSTNVYPGVVMKADRNTYNNAIKQIDNVIKTLKNSPVPNKDARFKNAALAYRTGMRKLVASTGSSLLSIIHNKKLSEKVVVSFNKAIQTYGTKQEVLINTYAATWNDLLKQYGLSSQ